MAPGIPSTNNGIEVINQLTKIQNTFRERHELSCFLTFAQNDIVLNWSLDRFPSGQAKFSDITLYEWTEVYQLAISYAQSIKSNDSVFVESESFNANLKDTVPVIGNKKVGMILIIMPNVTMLFIRLFMKDGHFCEIVHIFLRNQNANI